MIGSGVLPSSKDQVDDVKNVVDTINGKVALDATVAKEATLTGRVGALADHISVPFVPDSETVIAYLQTGYYHVHGASFVYPDKAAPVTLTSAVAEWAETGNIIEVIPASTIIKAFDLHWCSLSDISAVLDGIVDIFAGGVGAEVKIGAVDVVRTANFSRENAVTVQVP